MTLYTSLSYSVSLGTVLLSSFSSYYSGGTFLEDKLIREIFNSEEYFRDYVLTNTTDECLEFENKKDDEWAKSILKNRFGLESGTIVQTYDRKSRDEILQKMKKLE